MRNCCQIPNWDLAWSSFFLSEAPSWNQNRKFIPKEIAWPCFIDMFFIFLIEAKIMEGRERIFWIHKKGIGITKLLSLYQKGIRINKLPNYNLSTSFSVSDGGWKRVCGSSCGKSEFLKVSHELRERGMVTKKTIEFYKLCIKQANGSC